MHVSKSFPAQDDAGDRPTMSLLTRRLDQIGERQSKDAWILEGLAEKLESLSARITAQDADETAGAASSQSALERLEARLDAVHYAIGAAPRAISGLTQRVDALQATVADGTGPSMARSTAEAVCAALGDGLKAPFETLSERLSALDADRRALATSTAEAAIDALGDGLETPFAKLSARIDSFGSAQPSHIEASASSAVEAMAARLEAPIASLSARIEGSAPPPLETMASAIADALASRLEQPMAALAARVSAVEETQVSALRDAASMIIGDVPKALSPAIDAIVSDRLEAVLGDHERRAAEREANLAMGLAARQAAAETTMRELREKLEANSEQVRTAIAEQTDKIAEIARGDDGVSERLAGVETRLDSIKGAAAGALEAPLEALRNGLREDWSAALNDRASDPALTAVAEQVAALGETVSNIEATTPGLRTAVETIGQHQRAAFEAIMTTVGGDARSAEMVRERIERLLAAFGPASQEVTRAAAAVEELAARASADGGDQNTAGFDLAMAEALEARLAAQAEATTAIATRLDDLAATTAPEAGDAGATLEALDAKVTAQSEATASIASQLQNLIDAAAAQPTAEAGGFDLAMAEALEARLVAQSESMGSVASRLDSLLGSYGEDVRATEALRSRIERLLAAFGGVSRDVSDVVARIDDIASPSTDTGPLDTVLERVASLETRLVAQMESMGSVSSQLDSLVGAHGDDARATEALRSRIERLLAAFGGVSRDVSDVVARIDNGAASSGDAEALTAVLERVEALETRLVQTIEDQGASATPAADDRRDAVAQSLMAQKEAVDRLLCRVDAQITHSAGLVAGQESVRRRIDALFLATRHMVSANAAFAEAEGEASSVPSTPVIETTSDAAPTEATPATIEASASQATTTAAETAGPPASSLPPMFDAAELTTLRVAVGFRALFRRLSDVVERFEAASQALPKVGAPSVGERGARAAAAAALSELCRRVEGLSAGLLDERKALSAPIQDGDDGPEVDVRLARLEASAVTIERHKEEFLAIAAATSRALDAGANGAAAEPDAFDDAAPTLENAMDEDVSDIDAQDADASDADAPDADALNAEGEVATLDEEADLLAADDGSPDADDGEVEDASMDEPTDEDELKACEEDDALFRPAIV